MKWVGIWVFGLVGGLVSTLGEGLNLDASGARFGFSNNTSDRRYLQSEAFTDWVFPWRLGLGEGWATTVELDASAGWLNGRGNEAFIGTLGPRLKVRQGESRFNFALGVSPTYVTETEFGDKDFGVPLQFTSHLGLECRPVRHVQIGYRFQHMSNAGLDESNPGLNLHMFTLGWEF